MNIVSKWIVGGRLLGIPKSMDFQKEIFSYIIENEFESGCAYSEKEVNEKLGRYYYDFVTLRRALVDLKLLKRAKDGSFYEKY